jgi:acyl-CoA reductase-like NAD-dependent aldehyde dehydrogenase
LHDEHHRLPRTPFVLGRTAVVRRVPLGVVGVIGPWNFPLANNFSDCIPPLMAGNCVVLKPSEITPLSSLKIAEVVRECGLPEGVFSVAAGRGETRAALVDEVDRGGPRMLPSTGPGDSGQLCLSVERIYVEAPVYNRFVDLVTEKVRDLRHGASVEPAVSDIGAIIFPPQMGTIERHVRDALGKGARDAEEAIRLANDSPYGLGASLWTRDSKRGAELARRLQAGGVCVSCSTAADDQRHQGVANSQRALTGTARKRGPKGSVC